jgi:hypothetical protein
MIQYIKDKIARVFLRKVTLALWEKDLERREDAIVERETALAYKERALELAVERNNEAVDEMEAELEDREKELSEAIDQNTKMMLGLYLSDEKRRLNVH